MRRGLFRNSKSSNRNELLLRLYGGLSGSNLESDRKNWPISHLLPYCVVDWASGDGINPHIGPKFTQTGPDRNTRKTHLYGPNGRVLADRFTTSNKLISSEVVDPSATNDVIVMGFVRSFSASQQFAANRVLGGYGVNLNSSLSVGKFSLGINGSGGSSFPSINGIIGSWAFMIFVLERGGNCRSYMNGVLKDTRSIASVGDLGSGSGFSIGCLPDGFAAGYGDISRILFYYGDNIADIVDDDEARRISNVILGNEAFKTDEIVEFDRSSVATMQDDLGEWHVLTEDMPRIRWDLGILCEGARTNKCFNNINPTVTTGISASGGTLSIVNDSTELQANGCEAFGPNVFQLANATGSTQYLILSDTTGNTNDHSLGVFCRIVAGSGAELGLRDDSSGAFVKGADVLDDYERTIANNMTSGDTDCRHVVAVPDGCTVRVIMGTLEEAEFASTPIPNVATAATATRLQDIPSISVLPNENEARIEATIKSEGWSGTAPENTYFLTSSSGGGLWLYMSASATRVYTYDGTSILQSDSNAITGLSQNVIISWGTKLYQFVEGKGTDEDDYDGAFGATGNWGFGVRNTASPFAWCKDLKLYKRQS